MYAALCDEYNAGNYQRIVDLLGFISGKASKVAFTDSKKHADLLAIRQYAETDF